MASYCAAFLLSALIAAGDPVEVHVAPNGLDSAPGTPEAPLATLAGARDHLRRLRPSGVAPGTVTVVVHDGTYTLTEPLLLEEEDSGAAEAPVVFRAAEGARPVLTGGAAVNGFTPHRGDILKAEAGALSEVELRVLVWNGKRQELARYPNRNPDHPHGGDWAYVEGERFSMYSDSPDEDDYHATHQHLDFWQRNIPRLTRTLRLKPQDVRAWAHAEEAEVSVFPRFNWSHYMVGVESLDPDERVLHLKPGSYYEMRPGDRYFVRNVLEELDHPGEWYLDRQDGTLYFWPPAPLEDEPVYAAALQNVVRMQGCRYIGLEGFTIECSNGPAVVMEEAVGCRIARCTVRNAGDVSGSGIHIEGGRENGVEGCDIYDVGYCGIYMKGGDLESLTPGAHYADNNYIHHVGLVSRDAKAIELNGCLHRVTHNLIHDTPQSGLYVWGAGHTIEYNHIRHTCLESEDTGAIGGGAIDWLSWLGTRIRYNIIADTMGYGYSTESGRWESPHLTWSLYPDWAASGVEIRGNIIVRGHLALLHLHSGRDNIIENNVFADGGQSAIDWNGWTTDTGFWSTMVDGWIEKYEAAEKHAAWRAVRGFKDPRSVPLPDGRVMTGNAFRRNIVWCPRTETAVFRFKDVPLDHNESDYNLIYAAGPVRTGEFYVKRALGPNLIANPGLEEGAVGAYPEAWLAGEAPDPATAVRVVEDGARSGSKALLFEAAPPREGEKVVKQTYVALSRAPYKPNATYRLSAWLKGSGTDGRVTLVAYSWWTTKVVPVTPEWVRHEFVFRLPEGGDSRMPPHQGYFRCHLAFPHGAGRIWVDDVSLEEVEVSDEWEGWQAQGLDTHSILADPLFNDPQRDDFRLKPESPAFALGFEPIPVEKIGPYADERRASWPIVEVPGAREALQGRDAGADTGG